jgi:hypothetical protein
VRNSLLAEGKFFGKFLSKLLSLVSSITMAPKPPKGFWPFFQGEKKNTSHWKAHCECCDGVREIPSEVGQV